MENVDVPKRKKFELKETLFGEKKKQKPSFEQILATSVPKKKKEDLWGNLK